MIDAHDHKAVEMLDIENAFLHTENDKYVLLMLCVKLVELLVKVDPKLYRKYVITSKQGVTMIYAKLTKAIYGILCIAMLFYNKLRSHLEEIGYEINPHDPCVANITLNSSLMTVCWNVDDLKVSQK